VRDLEVDREHPIRIDEEVLRRPVAERQRPARGEEPLDLRLDRGRELRVRHRGRDVVRVGAALDQHRLIGEALARGRVAGREPVDAPEQRADAAGDSRIRLAAQEIVLPQRPAGRHARDHERERVLVAVEHARDGARREPPDQREGVALAERPPPVERPVRADAELRQRLLDDDAAVGPADAEDDVGDAAAELVDRDGAVGSHHPGLPEEPLDVRGAELSHRPGSRRAAPRRGGRAGRSRRRRRSAAATSRA
jgi:hypothetical protein